MLSQPHIIAKVVLDQNCYLSEHGYENQILKSFFKFAACTPIQYLFCNKIDTNEKVQKAVRVCEATFLFHCV